MRPLFRLGLFFAAALVACSQIGDARADDAGDRVIAAMDLALNRARSLSFEYEVVHQDAGKNPRMHAMKVLCKGPKRRYEFAAPSDLKGTRFLILSPTEIYVYLPAFGRVRRVASHTHEQSFLGLCFSQDDLATTAFGMDYTGVITAESPAQLLMVLTPKAGRETPYARIEVTLNRDGMVPAQMKYFNNAGVNIKTQQWSGYSRVQDIYLPGELKMCDHIHGSWTRFTVKGTQVNPEIPDEMFTVRKLGEQ